MELIRVKDVLRDEYQLLNPTLNVLIPNNECYSCYLMQPHGPVFADQHRIGNLNPEAVSSKYLQFLDHALTSNIDLVITPEYSFPWNVMDSILEGKRFPEEGKLWVLGCESIAITELSQLINSHNSKCKVIRETLTGNGAFCDPLAYCFKTRDSLNNLQNVILFQFKTTASRDNVFLENERLICGSKIYSFKNDPNGLMSLSSIICSDSLWLESHPQFLNGLVDRSILIHIQLNPSPRHSTYGAYRRHLFGINSSLNNNDLICLNWAQNIVQHSADDSLAWNNIAGSTWYVPKDRCTTKDSEILRNHHKGLYYSYLNKEHRHALLLNYEEAVFHLNVSKPVFDGPEVLFNRHGPKMVDALLWDVDKGDWIGAHEDIASGLESILNSNPLIQSALQHCSTVSGPIAVERAIALVCGLPKNVDTWHQVDNVESFQMASDEIVKRLTFTQDTDNDASTFRHRRYMLSVELSELLTTHNDWPPQVKDIQGAQLQWQFNEPNSNVHKDGIDSALIINFGADPQLEKATRTAEAMLELRRRNNPDTHHRIAAFYRSLGVLHFIDFPSLSRIDLVEDSLVSITNPGGGQHG